MLLERWLSVYISNTSFQLVLNKLVTSDRVCYLPHVCQRMHKYKSIEPKTDRELKQGLDCNAKKPTDTHVYTQSTLIYVHVYTQDTCVDTYM